MPYASERLSLNAMDIKPMICAFLSKPPPYIPRVSPRAVIIPEYIPNMEPILRDDINLYKY